MTKARRAERKKEDDSRRLAFMLARFEQAEREPVSREKILGPEFVALVFDFLPPERSTTR